MEVALEAGAEDVLANDDGSIDVITRPDEYEAVRAAMTGAGLKPEHSEVTMRAGTASPGGWRQRPAPAQAPGHAGRPGRRAECIYER
jgi:hypothetical protein